MTILWLRPGQQIHLKYSGFKKTMDMHMQCIRISEYSIIACMAQIIMEPEKNKNEINKHWKNAN